VLAGGLGAGQGVRQLVPPVQHLPEVQKVPQAHPLTHRRGCHGPPRRLQGAAKKLGPPQNLGMREAGKAGPPGPQHGTLVGDGPHRDKPLDLVEASDIFLGRSADPELFPGLRKILLVQLPEAIFLSKRSNLRWEAHGCE